MSETLEEINKMSVKELNEYYSSFGKQFLFEEGLMSAGEFRKLNKKQKIQHLENNNLFERNIEQTDEEIREEDAFIQRKMEEQERASKEWLSMLKMKKNEIIDMIMTERYGEDWFELV